MPAPPIGVVLAGGAATRLPEKPLRELRGRPLISYPLAALGEVLSDVVVVAKQPLPGLLTWVEPPMPRHPLCGIRHALERAGGRAVLICAADMPLIDAGELRAIIAARAPGEALAVVPQTAGRLQPLCALYEPDALARLPLEGRLRDAARGLSPTILVRPAARYVNVNTEAELAALNQPNVNE